MTFTLVYDANVLYPNTLRDLLIRIAQSGVVHAKVHDLRSVKTRKPEARGSPC
jgi:hypothetical protein